MVKIESVFENKKDSKTFIFYTTHNNLNIIEEDKKIVHQRLKDFDGDKMIPWKETKKSFKLKYSTNSVVSKIEK